MRHRLLDWLWRRLEPRVQAAVTERIILFHDSLVKEGRLPKGYPPEPPRSMLAMTADDLRRAMETIPGYAWVCVSGAGPLLEVVVELGANEPFILLVGK